MSIRTDGFKRDGVGQGDLLQAYTLAGLPAAGQAGRVARVTDDVRGLWMDSGTKWFPVNGGVISVQEFGAKGDGVTNDVAAIQAAIDAAGNTGAGDGLTVFVPDGVYYLADNLCLRRPIRFIGAAGSLDYGGVTLRFLDGKGLKLQGFNVSADGGGFNGGTLSGMRITSTGTTVANVDGIHVTAPQVTIERVRVDGFSRDGIHIEASIGGAPAANANLWRIKHSRAVSNGRHGLYLQGTDANAGVAELFDATSNGGWGIYEDSSLGNTFIGCHAAGNTSGPYTQPNNPSARSVWLGCYSEGGGNPSKMTSLTSVIIGGTHGAGFDTKANGHLATTLVDAGKLSGRLYTEDDSGAQMLRFLIGINRSLDEIFGFQAEGDGLGDNDGWRLRYAALANGWYSFIHDQNATRQPLALSGNGAAEGGGHLWFPAGFYIGAAGTKRRWTHVNGAPPASGTWVQGDIAWDNQGTAGGFIGWVCTAGGTPGTWKQFGAIQP